MRQNTEKLNFTEYDNLVWSVIHKNMRLYMGNEEYLTISKHLYSLSFEIFANAKEKWSPEGGMLFSSWLYSQLDYKLQNEIFRKLNKNIFSNSEFMETEVSEEVEHKVEFHETQLTILLSLFEYALAKWEPKETHQLFWCYAFDETLGEYNPFLIKQIMTDINGFVKYEFFIDVILEHDKLVDVIQFNRENWENSIDQDKLNEILKNDFFLTQNLIISIHKFICKEFVEDFKMKNNIKNKIKYFVKKNLGDK